MGMRTKCRAFLIAFIIIWWNMSNSTMLLDTTLEDHHAISDATSSNRTINTTTSSENYLNRDAPKNCHRRCTHYESKIFYANTANLGGLDDRIRLINAMSNLASFLCAELYLLVRKYRRRLLDTYTIFILYHTV